MSSLKPAVLVADVVGADVRLNWTEGGRAPAEYQVFRGGVRIVTLAGSVKTYTNTGVVAGTTYSYYIRSYRLSVPSVQSNTVTVLVTLPAAAVPTTSSVLSGTAGAAQVSLSWTPVTYATSYTLQRKSGAGAYADVVSQTGLTYVNTGLVNATAYTFRVRGTLGASVGPWSNELTKTPAATLPVAPTLTGVAGDSENTLDWNVVANASTYRLRRQIGTDPVTTYADTTATDYIDDAVVNDTDYQYAVRGIASDGQLGPLSAPLILTPTAAVPSPTPPPPPPSTGDLQTLINAAASGATINYSGTYAGAVVVNKPLTIVGGQINGQVTISASNVTLRQMVILGSQGASYVSSQNVIYAANVNNLIFDRCEVGKAGNAAIRLHYVDEFDILGCNIHDAVYAGIITTSSTDGLIDGGTVSRIGVTGASANSDNAYGITLTRFGTTDPKSARITISNVTVTDVPTWHGLDTHGGLDLVFEDNIIRGCYRGIMLTAYGGQNNIVRNNLIEQSSQPTTGRGMLVSDNQSYQITGNTIIGPLPTGIHVLAGSCGAISGNIFTNVSSPIYNQGTAC